MSERSYRKKNRADNFHVDEEREALKVRLNKVLELLKWQVWLSFIIAGLLAVSFLGVVFYALTR